ncbi:hypothetical protein Rhal01_03813 [Rubritalea halochordaticola]|uniref:Uncharacterized protein n=1 Tax=Rubritalea halochordaticola TaxID=714537 RepID=A0ABP9VAG1_9BACT
MGQHDEALLDETFLATDYSDWDGLLTRWNVAPAGHEYVTRNT